MTVHMERVRYQLSTKLIVSVSTVILHVLKKINNKWQISMHSKNVVANIIDGFEKKDIDHMGHQCI